MLMVDESVTTALEWHAGCSCLAVCLETVETHGKHGCAARSCWWQVCGQPRPKQHVVTVCARVCVLLSVCFHGCASLRARAVRECVCAYMCVHVLRANNHTRTHARAHARTRMRAGQAREAVAEVNPRTQVALGTSLLLTST